MRGDLRLFLSIAQDLGLKDLGRGPDLTLSYGAFAEPGGAYAMAPGVWNGHSLEPVNINQIAEDARHAWLADGGAALPPAVGLTLPQTCWESR